MTSICIFGSVARKDHDGLSDKDVLILSDGSEATRQIQKKWKNDGWSVATYSSNRLVKMANSGSLFLQHLKQEGMITEDADDILGDVLSNYSPMSDYSAQITETLLALELLERVPSTHELDYWSADLLHVIIRNIGILRLANEGIYTFSFKNIAENLINIGLIHSDERMVFEKLRAAKTSYRSGVLPIKPVNKVVDGGLEIINKLCGVTIERTPSLDFSKPQMTQPYFNLRAMEKILVAYLGLPLSSLMYLNPKAKEIWKRVVDPRAYSWDIKARQDDLWQILFEVVKLDQVEDNIFEPHKISGKHLDEDHITINSEK